MYNKCVLFFVLLWILTGLGIGELKAQRTCNVAMDSLLQQAIRLSEHEDYVRSFDLLEELKKRIDQNMNEELLFWYYTNKGINLAETMSYDDALDSFLEAYSLASEKLDKRKVMSVVNNIAGVYMLMGKPQQAYEYFRQNFKSACEIGDSSFVGGSALNMANTLLRLSRMDECEEYLELAGRYIPGKTPDKLTLELLRMEFFLKKKQYEAVVYGGLGMLATVDSGVPKSFLQDTYAKLCMAYGGLKRWDRVIDMADLALADQPDLSGRLLYYDLLSRAYEAMQIYPKAIAYKDSLMIAKDSVFKRTEHAIYVNNNVRFQLLENEKKKNEYHARAERNLILSVSMLVVCMLLVWLLIVLRIRSRQKQHIAELQIEQQRKDLELLQNKQREQDAEALLKKREYQLELEKRNRELMSKAMFVAHRNDSIQTLIAQLSENVKIERNSQLDRNIRLLKNQLEENTEWEDFNVYFEQINQEFIWTLHDRHPDLSASEIRFLSLIYIGLNNKEISSILNITAEYCKKKKQVLAKKMGLDNTRSLYAYLVNM